MIFYHGTDDEDFEIDPDRFLWATDSRALAGLYGERVVPIEVDLDALRVLDAGGPPQADSFSPPAEMAEDAEYCYGSGKLDKEALVDVASHTGAWDAVAFWHGIDQPGPQDGKLEGGRVIALIGGCARVASEAGQRQPAVQAPGPASAGRAGRHAGTAP